MSQKIMPMRYNIIRQLILNPKGLTPTRLYEILRDIYVNEKQCSISEMDRQMMSLEIAGLVEIADTYEKKDGSIESSYRITPYGQNRAQKYIKNYLK